MFELQDNQSALILTEGEGGEITVDVASANTDGFSMAICQAIAQKLLQDEEFLDELLDDLD